MGRAKESTLTDRIQEIKERAKKSGIEQNFFFVTTLERYEQLLKIGEGMKAEVDRALASGEYTTTKSYSNGKDNTYANPIFASYDRVVASANKTVETLMKIIRGFESSKEDHPDDPLMDILNGTVE